MTFERFMRRAGRTILLYGWFLALSACTARIFESSFLPQLRAQLTQGVDPIIWLGSTVLSLFVLYSCLRQFALNDHERYLAWAAAAEPADAGRRAFAAAVRAPSFLCEAVVLTALSLAVPPVAGWGGLTALADAYWPLPPALRRVLIGGFTTLLVNVFHLLAHLRAEKTWRMDAKAKEMMGGGVGRRRMMAPGWRRLLLYALFVTVGYCFLSFALLPMGFLIGGLFVTLAGVLSWQIAVVVLCLFVLLTGHRYLRALRAVRRFKKELRNICREAGYTCTGIRNLYRSVLAGRHCGTFTVLVGEKRYDCCVVSAVRRGNRMYLDGKSCMHEFSFRLFRRTLFRYYHTTPLDFPEREDAAGGRILIVHPTPHSMLVQREGTVREGVTGDCIGGYTLYNAKSFLGCLSRDCLPGGTGRA